MKIKLDEVGEWFEFNMEAESIADAALLIRLGMNLKKLGDDSWSSAWASKQGAVVATVSLKKYHYERSEVINISKLKK